MRLFPNMKWLPSASSHPREEHIPFYNRIWAKDDPFWATNMPGSLWNCKCSLQETDDDATENATVPAVAPATGLDGNPGITGEIFTEEASYFQRAPKEAEKECNKAVFKDNKEWAMTNLKGKSVKPKEFSEEIHFSGRGINEYLNQPHDDYFVKNEMIRSMMSILKESEYLGYTKYEGRTSHVFKTEIRKKANYILAIKRNPNDMTYFYSITGSEKVLIGLKK